ncbi:8-oxo-dGTP pyrophosphatase MutT (NUDIX family) [Neisseria perflava]|uniref:NUDIX hydrolase n=1 Tax=Neisseria perflava TaxID=33053 RepID=UPI00209CEB8E|nr:NUDIX domain-containing protein [Neisseria perflava]MCP1771814.1 8-oxo-dGTP pyrophosphatase MutT (NUDIX family) [Neisseria perflava]
MSPGHLTDFFNRAAAYPSDKENLRNRFIQPQQRCEAAVLLPVVCRQQQWQLLLTRRADTLRHHTGQVALPGGRWEPQDADFNQTALRETEEETGISAAAWQTFPLLPPHYTPSGYEVHPVPALYTAAHAPHTVPNPDEVAEIFYVPLYTVLDTTAYRSRPLQFNGSSIDAPVLPYLHYNIWGLTAIILYSLAERYQAYCLDK